MYEMSSSVLGTTGTIAAGSAVGGRNDGGQARFADLEPALLSHRKGL